MNFKKIISYITYASLFLVPFAALIVTNSLPAPFISGKAFFFRILVEIAFTGWAILAILDEKYRPKLTLLTVTISLFAIVTLIADLLGVDQLNSLWSYFERMEGWITIIHLWAFYMVIVNMFGSGNGGKRYWRAWLNISLLVATVVGIGALCQLFGWSDFYNNAGRADAFLGNSAFLAVYMLIHFFIAVYLSLDLLNRFYFGKNCFLKKTPFVMFCMLAYPTVALLFAYITFGTQTRGAIFGLIGGIVVALALYALFGKTRIKSFRGIFGGVIVTILVIGMIFWFNRGSSFVRHSALLSRFASISLTDPSVGGREYIWMMALEGVMEHPVLGWGQENYSYVFQADYNPLLYDQGAWFDRAHNVFLDWSVSSGIVGLIVYLGLYVLFVIYVWRSSLGVVEKSVLTGLLAGYAIHNLFVFDSLMSYILFFAILGYANSLKRPILIEQPHTQLDHIHPAKYTAIIIVVIAVSTSVYFFNIRPILATMDLTSALKSYSSGHPVIALFQKVFDDNIYLTNRSIHEQLLPSVANVVLDPKSSNETKQSFMELAGESINGQLADMPNDARSYAMVGSFLDQIGQIDQAGKYLERAHELAPAKQLIDFELATDYLYQQKPEQAVALLKQAYESAPKYEVAASAYAVVLTMVGKDDEALKIFTGDSKVLTNVRSYVVTGQYLKAIIIYRGIVVDKEDVGAQLNQAQMEYGSGMMAQAVQTLQYVVATHPEYKDQIEAAIKQIRERPAP